MYNDQIATIYAVENGFVVECREEKPKDKSAKEKGMCCPSDYETKTYTAANEAQVLKIIRTRMGVKASKEYDAGFSEAASK